MRNKKQIISIFIAFVWISISEFARNSFILHQYWVSHYHKLGLKFPDAPVNGAMWGLWSLLFAIAIFILSRKYTFMETFLFAWVLAFVFMWVVIGNLGVLPFETLPVAIPASLFETYLATLIIHKLGTEKWIQ